MARYDYYCNNQKFKIVPFDLALLCATRITWRKINNTIIAFADLPELEEQNTNDEVVNLSKRIEGFNKVINIPLWGICPIYSQGWQFLNVEVNSENSNYLSIIKQLYMVSVVKRKDLIIEDIFASIFYSTITTQTD